MAEWAAIAFEFPGVRAEDGEVVFRSRQHAGDWRRLAEDALGSEGREKKVERNLRQNRTGERDAQFLHH